MRFFFLRLGDLVFYVGTVGIARSLMFVVMDDQQNVFYRFADVNRTS